MKPLSWLTASEEMPNLRGCIVRPILTGLLYWKTYAKHWWLQYVNPWLDSVSLFYLFPRQAFFHWSTLQVRPFPIGHLCKSGLFPLVISASQAYPHWSPLQVRPIPNGYVCKFRPIPMVNPASQAFLHWSTLQVRPIPIGAVSRDF